MSEHKFVPISLFHNGQRVEDYLQCSLCRFIITKLEAELIPSGVLESIRCPWQGPVWPERKTIDARTQSRRI